MGDFTETYQERISEQSSKACIDTGSRLASTLSPFVVDEMSCDSGIVVSMPESDDPNDVSMMNVSAADMSFEIMTSLPETGNTPTSLQAASAASREKMAADFSGASFIMAMDADSAAADDDSINVSQQFVLPTRFSDLLEGSVLLSSSECSFNATGSSNSSGGRKQRNSGSASSSSSSGRRRRHRLASSATSGRRLLFDDSWASASSPAVGQQQQTTSVSPREAGGPGYKTRTIGGGAGRRLVGRVPLAVHRNDQDQGPTATKATTTAAEIDGSGDGSTTVRALSASDEQLHSLIGDLSAGYVLPVVSNSKHPDLKTITPDTLVELMNNEYSDSIERFHIIDCRYPYEYDGGHIENALNICCKDDIVSTFIDSDIYRQQSSGTCCDDDEHRRRTVFVFHCEFSSERAPTLLRFLRNQDRAAHSDCYPRLHYPELYLLEGGYKAFYESHVERCLPPMYRPMLHADHAADLRHFRAKSKSCQYNGKRAPLQPVAAGGRRAGATAASGEGQRSNGDGSSGSSSGLIVRRKTLWL